jgi:hypothetical protein
MSVQWRNETERVKIGSLFACRGKRGRSNRSVSNRTWIVKMMGHLETNAEFPVRLV